MTLSSLSLSSLILFFSSLFFFSQTTADKMCRERRHIFSPATKYTRRHYVLSDNICRGDNICRNKVSFQKSTRFPRCRLKGPQWRGQRTRLSVYSRRPRRQSYHLARGPVSSESSLRGSCEWLGCVCVCVPTLSRLTWITDLWTKHQTGGAAIDSTETTFPLLQVCTLCMCECVGVGVGGGGR